MLCPLINFKPTSNFLRFLPAPFVTLSFPSCPSLFFPTLADGMIPLRSVIAVPVPGGGLPARPLQPLIVGNTSRCYTLICRRTLPVSFHRRRRSDPAGRARLISDIAVLQHILPPVTQPAGTGGSAEPLLVLVGPQHDRVCHMDVRPSF